MATVREAKRATVDDLYKTPGKAELVNREIVLIARRITKDKEQIDYACKYLQDGLGV